MSVSDFGQSSQVSVIYDRIKQERDAVGDGRIGASNLDFLHRAIDVTGDYLEVLNVTCDARFRALGTEGHGMSTMSEELTLGLKRYERVHSAVLSHAAEISRLIHTTELQFGSCMKRLHPGRLVTATQKKAEYKPLIQDFLHAGSTVAKWLLTAQGKKNIIPADMSDVLGDAARRVMGLEDMYGDYQATRARQGVVAKLLQSDRAACTQAAKMYVQYLLECLGDGARSKTRADITELVLAQLVPRLTTNPFPNPVASGMDDGVFDVHTRLFVNDMSSPFEDDGTDDPIAVKEMESVPPPVKLMIPQLSFGPVGGNKDSPTAKSISVLPAVGTVRTPDKPSASVVEIRTSMTSPRMAALATLTTDTPAVSPGRSVSPRSRNHHLKPMEDEGSGGPLTSPLKARRSLRLIEHDDNLLHQESKEIDGGECYTIMTSPVKASLVLSRPPLKP